MEKSYGEKILPDLDLSPIKTKKMQKALSDIPAEFPIEGDEQDTESESSSDSSSDSEYECSVCQKTFSGYIPLKQHEKGKSHAKAVLRIKRERKLLEKGGDDENATGGDARLIPEPCAICKACDKEFHGPESYQAHLKSRNHKQKVLEDSILEQVRENGEINVEKLRELYKNKRKDDFLLGDTKESLKLDDEFECKECDKVFSGLTPFAQHVLSKNHEKHVEKKNLLHKVISESCEEDEGSSQAFQRDITTLCLEDGVLVCKLCSTSFSGPESASMHLRSKKHSKNLDKHIWKLKRKREKQESTHPLSGSSEIQKERFPEKESPGEVAKEGSPSTTESPGESEKADNPEEERMKPPASKEETEESFTSRENYKKYKELMHSLREEDKVLK